MTRSTAREIAIHLAYQLSFTELPVEEFLDQQLSDERFAELAAEDDLYADRPNTKQEAYIRRLVSGVAEHAAELDADIEKYARGWRFERISLVASAIMRVAMYEILYMADIPQGAAISEAVTNAIVHAYPQEIGKIALRACIFDGNLLEITVRDWGCGIADVEKAREPLYTTGGEERSGMGFTIMESFMDSLAVRSKNGKGTVVTMKRRIALRTARR